MQPRFAGHGDYARHFGAIASGPPTRAALEHLLVHLESALDAEARVALWRALWSQWAGLDTDDRAQAARLLDGRFRTVLGWLDTPFDHPATLVRLAEAHLAEGELHCPGFVFALYRHHGLEPAFDEPQQLPAALAWPLVQAELRLTAPGALDARRAASLQQTSLALAEADGEQVARALLTLFEIGVRANDALASTEALAECLRCGLQPRLPVSMLRAWLEAGRHEQPLALAGGAEARAIAPARWHESAHRAALAAALSRPGAHERLAALSTALGETPAEHAPADEALNALAALDRGYAKLDADANDARFADAAIAALHHAHGERAAAEGRVEDAAIAFAAARRLDGHAGAEAALWSLLEAQAPQDAAAARAVDDEEARWRALADSAAPRIARVAQAQLAALWTDGALVPCQTARRQRLPEAKALWQSLAAHAPWRALADERLRSVPFALMSRLLSRPHGDAGGREHLWLETPGAQRVLIVFSCVDSHHSFTSVPSLVQGLRGHHLLFVNNPELNWYSGTAFEATCRVIEARVLSRFAREDVACYFGSMGGYAALRFALHFGLRAIAFNPQVDLDLWAAYRPMQRALIHGEAERVHLQDLPREAFARAPLYYTVGSATADRCAFSRFVARVAECDDARLVVEKFADPHHAGLIRRTTRGQIPQAIEAIDRRLGEIAVLDDPARGGFAEVPADERERFWARVDAAQRLKLEIVVRAGRVWTRESTDCATAAA
ncbi:hypothetical protein [Caldimonas sp. KR1-144]|uniref:hypothetical protein n=1 Tax=Caldimonas sp. KR1-144 TaxID=3400911 RepID=UPI003C1106CD